MRIIRRQKSIRKHGHLQRTNQLVDKPRGNQSHLKKTQGQLGQEQPPSNFHQPRALNHSEEIPCYIIYFQNFEKRIRDTIERARGLRQKDLEILHSLSDELANLLAKVEEGYYCDEDMNIGDDLRRSIYNLHKLLDELKSLGIRDLLDSVIKPTMNNYLVALIGLDQKV